MVFMRWFRPKVMMFIHLVTDADIIVPLLTRAAQSRRFPGQPLGCVTEECLKKSPTLEQTLRATGAEWCAVGQQAVLDGTVPNLRGVGALVTATETSVPAHRASHVLICRAKEQGIRTYTLQHGFVNIGLTFFDQRYTPDTVRFASDTI